MQVNDLSPSSDMPNSLLMRIRPHLGLILAVAGICLGVSGVVFGEGVLVILAGVAGVIGCFVLGRAALLPFIAHERVVPTPTFRETDANEPALPDESVIDTVTSLPDARYFDIAFEGRVAAARRHLWPVSVVLLQLGFDEQNNSELARNESLAKFGELMRQTLREADIACRLDDKTFGLILEDTSEEGGVWTAERLQIALSHDATTIRRLVAGIAAYPSHGLFPKDVMTRARTALNRANAVPVSHGLGQVEVAHVDLS